METLRRGPKCQIAYSPQSKNVTNRPGIALASRRAAAVSGIRGTSSATQWRVGEPRQSDPGTDIRSRKITKIRSVRGDRTGPLAWLGHRAINAGPRRIAVAGTNRGTIRATRADA